MEPLVFDHQIMTVNLADTLSKIEDPQTLPFLAMLKETLKIFQQMGGALAMAFSGFFIIDTLILNFFLDIQQKMDLVRIGMKTMELQANCPENSGLFTLMENEIKLNVHILNGENWETVGDKNQTFRFYESSNCFFSFNSYKNFKFIPINFIKKYQNFVNFI